MLEAFIASDRIHRCMTFQDRLLHIFIFTGNFELHKSITHVT